MGAKVTEQPPCGEGDHGEQREDGTGLGRSVVPGELDDDDQRGESDQGQRDHAVETARLGVRPRVERP